MSEAWVVFAALVALYAFGRVSMETDNIFAIIILGALIWFLIIGYQAVVKFLQK